MSSSKDTVNKGTTDPKERLKEINHIKQEILEKYGAMQEDEFSDILFKDIQTYARREMSMHDAAMQIAAREEEQYRGISLTFGQIGACDIEVSMRMHNGHVSYYTMRPAQCIEYIHQLAALVGLAISIKPRDDFSSYRAWKEVDGYDNNYIGFESEDISGVGEPGGAETLKAIAAQKADIKERNLIEALSSKIEQIVYDKVEQLQFNKLEEDK